MKNPSKIQPVEDGRELPGYVAYVEELERCRQSRTVEDRADPAASVEVAARMPIHYAVESAIARILVDCVRPLVEDETRAEVDGAVRIERWELIRIAEALDMWDDRLKKEQP